MRQIKPPRQLVDMRHRKTTASVQHSRCNRLRRYFCLAPLSNNARLLQRALRFRKFSMFSNPSLSCPHHIKWPTPPQVRLTRREPQ